GQVEGVVEVGGDGLLGVHVLARLDGRVDGGEAVLGGEGVEVDVDLVVAEGFVEAGRVLVEAVAVGDLGELLGAAADQGELGPDHAAVGALDAALLADGEERAHELRVGVVLGGGQDDDALGLRGVDEGDAVGVGGVAGAADDVCGLEVRDLRADLV
ncbi:hypothetical protein ADL26_11120, partial [Thermoactinomyces vulgaris]